MIIARLNCIFLIVVYSRCVLTTAASKILWKTLGGNIRRSLVHIVASGATFFLNDFDSGYKALARDLREPIAQGVIDLDVAEKQDVPSNSKYLITVIDPLKPDTIVAGATLGYDTIQTPFRFQLFDENLLVKKNEWKLLMDRNFDQEITVQLCEDISLRSCSNSPIKVGKGLSKYTVIGDSNSGVRGIRIFPYIQLTKP